MIITDQKGGEGRGGETMAADQDSSAHTLYYFPFSMYSLIVRFAVELGYSLDPETSPHVKLRFLDLHQRENFSEEYLQISPNGQVPTLSCHSDAGPPTILTESQDILQWLCRVQPALLPEQHRRDIDAAMNLFYSFHAKPLNIKAEERSNGIPNIAAEMLERTDLTDQHRRSLEIRSVFHEMLYASCLNPDNVERVEEQARAFLNRVSSLAENPGNQEEGNAQTKKFIFGDSPTVLDAIATTLIARLQDMKRQDLLDKTLMEYARRVMETQAWQRTTHGRPTAWNQTLGKAADVNPL